MLPVSTVVGYAIGYGLDQWLHTSWLKIVFLILGSVGRFHSTNPADHARFPQ